MKQRLLLGILILFSISVFSQKGRGAPAGPTPPLGYLGYHICDSDGDGYEVFDLSTHFNFPFSIPGEEASNYNPTIFYLSEEDRNNNINPIPNPSTYINVLNPQKIYYRTYAINPGEYVYLQGDEFIHASAIPSPNLKNNLFVCDSNNNGLNTFNLTQANENILAGLGFETYTLTYYETFIDAESEVNKIANGSSLNLR